MHRLRALSLIVLIVLSASCRVQHTTTTAPSERDERSAEVVAETVAPSPPEPTAEAARITATPPELHSAIVTLTPSCAEGAPEVLNAYDDNCNGQVDEDFVESGDVQITLGWTTGADIDLYVTDPFDEELSFQSIDSSSGGRLDRSARGACTDGQTNENIFWTSDSAPRGTYRVTAHYFSDCQAAGVTPVVLSIMVGGRALGVYQMDLSPGQRIDLASFTVH